MLITNMPNARIRNRLVSRRHKLGETFTETDVMNDMDLLIAQDNANYIAQSNVNNSGGGFWEGIGNFFTGLVTPAAQVTSDYLKYQTTQNVVKSSPYYGYQQVYDPTTKQFKVVPTTYNSGFSASSLTFPVILAGAGLALFFILKKKR